MRTRPDVITDLSVGHRVVHLDEHGFLTDPEEWDADVAVALAKRQDIRLTDDHWDVIAFMRDFLGEHGVAADARFVIGSGKLTRAAT